MGRSATLVPDWLANLAALGWRVLAIAGLVVAAWLVGTLLWTVSAAIVLAVVVSAVFAPFMLGLRAKGRSRDSAAVIVWLAALLGIGGALLLFGLAVIPFAVEVAAWIDAGLGQMQARLAELQVPEWVGTLARDVVSLARDSAGGAAGGIVAAAAETVTVLLLASFLLFFFLRDGDRAWVWMFQAMRDEKRDLVTTAGDDALSRVGGYLRGTTVVAGLIAITDFAFMLVLGVPLALPLALLTFLGGYVPYFGGIATAAVVLLVTLASLGPGAAILMLALMGIRSAILHFFVRPRMSRRSVSIHPAVVLVALPAGYQLAGVIGLVAAVPVTAVIIAVARAVIAIVEPDTRPELPTLVPAWLDRMAQFAWRVLVGLAFIALLVAILVTLPLVVIPVILAIILAATLEPLVRELIARGRTRAGAAGIAVGGGFLLIGGVLALALGALVDQADSIARTSTTGAKSASDSLGGQLELAVDAAAAGTLEAARTIASLAAASATLIIVVVLSALLSYYLLRDGGGLWGRLVARLRLDASVALDAAGARAFEVLGGYMIGTAAISFVGAASQLVIMVVLGLPLALPVFVLSFLLGFIPYIGGFISTGLAFLIAIAVGDPLGVVVMGIWTIVFNLVTGNIVSPLVYGRTVHIHPAIVLVAIPAGSAIAGALGMFIVIPAIGVVATTWRTVLSLIGGHAPSPPGPRLPPAPTEALTGATDRSAVDMAIPGPSGDD